MAASADTTKTPVGNDRLLLGLVLAVLTFWLFATSAGALAPVILENINRPDQVFVSRDSMNLAVSITALFSGLFIVVFGGLADRFGRFKLLTIGLVLSIIGSALLVAATGLLAAPLLLTGRIIQGLSAAAVMPTSLGLVRACWDGAARQRAVSMWSIASFGGSGLSSIVAGVTATFLGWRVIYIVSVVVAVIALLLVRGQGESKVASNEPYHLDVPGIAVFMVGMLALMVVMTFGAKIGWGNPLVWGLLLVAAIGIGLMVFVEGRVAHPFLNLKLFANKMFSGATLANFLLNTAVGMLIVTQQLLILDGKLTGRTTPASAGLLTLGYAIAVIGFMRVGEKLLQRWGAKRPMLLGTVTLAVAGLFFLPTNLFLTQYKISAVVGYTLMGLGLAFFGTPATDAAMSSLPVEQSGAGAGIFKMASSLGSAVGTAVSLALFTAFSKGGVAVVGSVLEPVGRTDNIGIRQAASVAVGFNIAMILLSALVIFVMVPAADKARKA